MIYFNFLQRYVGYMLRDFSCKETTSQYLFFHIIGIHVDEPHFWYKIIISPLCWTTNMFYDEQRYRENRVSWNVNIQVWEALVYSKSRRGSTSCEWVCISRPRIDQYSHIHGFGWLSPTNPNTLTRPTLTIGGIHRNFQQFDITTVWKWVLFEFNF